MNDIGVSQQPATRIGHRNVVWGWSTMVLGGLTGGILSFWSFSGPFAPPPGFTDYADVPRRMMRLAHIALFALPLINIVLGRDLDRAFLSERWKQIVSWGAIMGMIALPLSLTLGAIIDIRFKYLSAIGINPLILSLGAMAVGMRRVPPPE